MTSAIPVILAAGKGTRLKTDRAKVLHEIYGVPLIKMVLDACSGIGSPLVIVGHSAEEVKAALPDGTASVVQEPQLGTGHAMMIAREHVENKCDNVLILCGDAPLITKETLNNLLSVHVESGNSATVLTAVMENPGSYGRIVRDIEDDIVRIVESRDATEEEMSIDEINSSIYVFRTEHLVPLLDRLKTDNTQKEYYLTDSIRLLINDGFKVGAMVCEDTNEIIGINSRVELAKAHEYIRLKKVRELMENGVTVVQPENCHISLSATVGTDTVIHPGVTILGSTKIGNNCVIERNVTILDCDIKSSVKIRDFCYLERACIGSDTSVGPFAHLRPGSVVGEHCKIGNFVEMKKTIFGDGSKASHLSYIGDAEVGRNVNIGAGTITCNYDGKNKYKTTIRDGVFVGSDSQFVAPVTIGENAYIGAGSTITKDVPPNSLAVARGRQFIKEDWVTRKKGTE